MIAFDLKCGRGHLFEGWFDSSKDFEEQKSSGLVECPICGDPEIQKVLSPIRSLGLTQVSEPATDGPPAQGQEQALKVRQLMKAVKQFLETNFEDVGADFATEALKIHYGVEPSRKHQGLLHRDGGGDA